MARYHLSRLLRTRMLRNLLRLLLLRSAEPFETWGLKVRRNFEKGR